MIRKVVDASDYQAGLALDTVSASVDGAWFKAGDWAYVSRYGWPADDIHDTAIARFTQLGKPVGSYLFVRPGMTAPATQIDGWAQHAPKGLTMRPMIDLEATSITGAALRNWIEEAIALATKAFGVAPCLYWSNAFAQGYGMSAPDAEHLPMVAEYHRGYTPFLWANRDNWESYAYGAFGGPDVPPGYGSEVTPRSLIWQCTSSAQIPGFAGLVDLDLVPDAAWAQLTSAHTVPADPIMELLAMPTNQEKLNTLYSIFMDEGGRWGKLWNAAAQTETIHGQLTNDQNFYNLVNNAAATHGGVSALQASVDKLAVGGVDAAKFAEQVRLALIAALTTGGTPSGTQVQVTAHLPDPSADARAATALADLSRAVFDPDTGVRGEVHRELEKMTKVADGHEVTNEQIADAVQGKLTDAARRAGVKAQES